MDFAKYSDRDGIGVRRCAFVFAAIAVLLLPGDAWAQPVQADQVQQAAQVQVAARPVAVNQAQPENDPPISVASVEFDVDADSVLSKAAEYLNDMQFTKALVLYQHVLDKYPTAMVLDDHGVYVPARALVVDILASAPRETLDSYRLTADGEARGLVCEDPRRCRDIDVLQRGADRFFLSSIGDNAVFTLACLQMDRGQYQLASMWLGKLAEHYPDSSIPRRAILQRLIVAAWQSGDPPAAERAIEQYRALGPVDEQAQQIIELAKAGLKSVGPKVADKGWPMFGGSARHDLAMPSLDPSITQKRDALWALVWNHSFGLRSPHGRWGGNYYQLQANAAQSRADLVQRWTEQKWLPTGQMIFTEGRVIYKTHEQVVCRNAATGEEVWSQTALENPTKPNSVNRYYNPHNHNTSPYPTTAEEALFFGDGVSKALSIQGDQLYHIQSHDIGTWLAPHEQQRRSAGRGNYVGGNALVAMDARTGQVKWKIGRSPDPKNELGVVRFRALPLLASDKLIVPVEINGEMFLLGLAPETGRVLFKQFLCSFPASYAPPWSTCGMALVGDEVYLLPGEGMVLAASVHDGKVRWARPYAQSNAQGRNPRWGGGANQSTGRFTGIRGWEANRVIPVGDTLVVAPWDAEQLMLISRRTGRLRSQNAQGQPAPIETPKARYVVGVRGNWVAVVANDQMMAYSMTNGELVWRAAVGEMTGRAAMTADAIYVPCGQSIVCLDPALEGKRVAIMRVITPRGDPLGNLLSDGDRLLAVGMNYAYALNDSQMMMARLDRALQSTPSAMNYLQRARLFEQVGKNDLALEDFRSAVALAQQPEVKNEAAEELIPRLLRILRSAPAAENAAAILAELKQLAGSDGAWGNSVALAEAEFHAAHGRVNEAFEVYKRLIVTHAATQKTEPVLVAMDDDMGRAYVLITTAAQRGLAKLAEAYPELVSITLDQHSQADWNDYQLKHAIASLRTEKVKAMRELYRLASTYAGTATAKQAVLKLGEFDSDVGLNEPEALLLRLAASPDRGTSALASASLSNLYQQSGWPNKARRFAQRLSRFDDLSVVWQGVQISATSLSEQLLASIGPVERIVHTTPNPPLKRVWELRGYGNYLLNDADDSSSPFLAEHMILMNRNKRYISCHRIDDVNFDEPVWRIPIPSDVSNRVYISNDEVYFSGDIRGNLLVIRGPEQLVGYSLITGKRLWVRDEKSSSARNRTWVQNQRNDSGMLSFHIGDDIIVSHRVDDELSDQVEVIDATSVMGGKTLWRRGFGDSSVSAVWAAKDAVAVLLDGGTRITMCDRLTGQIRNSVKLSNPVRKLVWSDNHVLVQQNDGKIACYDLADLSLIWRSKNGVNYVGLVGADRVYFYDYRGKVVIREIAQDKVVRELSRNDMGANINGGEMGISPDGKRLYGSGWSNNGHRTLCIVDLEGEAKPISIDTGQQYYSSPSMPSIARARGPIPWIIREKDDKGNWERHGKIVLYDRKTGERIKGSELPLTDPSNASRALYPQRSPTVRGNMLILTTNQGIIAFGHDPDAKKPEPDDAKDTESKDHAKDEKVNVDQPVAQEGPPAAVPVPVPVIRPQVEQIRAR